VWSVPAGVLAYRPSHQRKLETTGKRIVARHRLFGTLLPVRGSRVFLLAEIEPKGNTGNETMI
jgi:hypothetical protein